MSIRIIVKWVSFISLIWAVLFLANEFFIRDWRIQHSEQRVQKSIVKNYEGKEEKFEHLIKYIRKLEIIPKVEIEFTKNEIINSYLNSPYISDSFRINTTPVNLGLYDVEKNEIEYVEFEISPNGKARIYYTDTIIEAKNWNWNFEGGDNNPQFEKFITYLGISKRELENLRKLIKEIDCEAISIYQDSSFSFRYDGFSLCQYEYYIPKRKVNSFKNYKKLNDNIFCGLNRNELFCEYLIYDK